MAFALDKCRQPVTRIMLQFGQSGSKYPLSVSTTQKLQCVYFGLTFSRLCSNGLNLFDFVQEYPYPYASEECFDVYRSIVESNGAVIGMEGWYTVDDIGRRRRKMPIRVTLAGDSAGGNLCTTTTIRIIEYQHHHLPTPSGIVLVYPVLSFDMAAWMPPGDISMLRNESVRSFGGGSRKSSVIGNNAPSVLSTSNTVQPSRVPPATVVESDGEGDIPGGTESSPPTRRRRRRTLSWDGIKLRPMTAIAASQSAVGTPTTVKKAALPVHSGVKLDELVRSSPLALPPAPRTTGPITEDPPSQDTKAEDTRSVKWTPTTVHTALSMTSRLSYSFDRVLPHELLRGLSMLYLGCSPGPPDFHNDYLLNPVIAPDDVLARFPKTFIICGEK
ncbi:hypothetical protein HDU93_000641, partial [Gonapodya sp. JEL0774]